jgi:glycosyltransferase involved in cell wall biosynthesis
MAALAHGLPVVTTEPRSQHQEPRLVDGENVALVPPDDPAALAEAVVQLMAAPDLRRRLGEGARALAQSFSWDCIARQTVQLYQELVSP